MGAMIDSSSITVVLLRRLGGSLADRASVRTAVPFRSWAARHRSEDLDHVRRCPGKWDIRPPGERRDGGRGLVPPDTVPGG